AFQYSEKRIDLVPAENNHFHFGAYRLRAYYEVGGYAPLSVGEDKDLEKRLYETKFSFGKTDEIVQIYRWYSPYAHLATSKTQDVYDQFQSPIIKKQNRLVPHWKENYTKIIEKVKKYDHELRSAVLWHDIEDTPIEVEDANRFPSTINCLETSPSPSSILVLRDHETKILTIPHATKLTVGMLATTLFCEPSVKINLDGQRIGELRFPGEMAAPVILPAGNYLLQTQSNPCSIFKRPFAACSTVTKNQLLADETNTLFVAAAAWDDPFSATEVFRRSAERFNINVTFIDYGEKWVNFYINKIIHLRNVLENAGRAGKQFAFVLDCRDLVFTAPQWIIQAKFNGLYDGRVLFGSDLAGCVWPCQSERLLAAIQTTHHLYSILNAGSFAGEIKQILELYRKAMELYDELEHGFFRPGIVREIAGNIVPEYYTNDQFLFQILSVYFPQLIKVDTMKTLFAVFKDRFPNLHDRKREDPRKNDTVNFAPILHSPWLANNETEWKKWAQYYGLQENNK
ncbi:MAG: hypothetical protein LBQ50_07235, partial [Planctomycetaceae bacterium]|nr:hypothetical protein [Planctomycetaceae bacterium]